MSVRLWLLGGEGWTFEGCGPLVGVRYLVGCWRLVVLATGAEMVIGGFLMYVRVGLLGREASKVGAVPTVRAVAACGEVLVTNGVLVERRVVVVVGIVGGRWC